MEQSQTLVVYGAGNIGRGIVSYLFHRAGWRLLFYRRDTRALLDLKARGSYPVKLLGADGQKTQEITGFDVLTGREELVQALTQHSLAACCLYPSAFPAAAEAVAQAYGRREKRGNTAPLNLLLCCNEPGGREQFCAHLEKALGKSSSGEWRNWLGVVPVLVYSVGFPAADREDPDAVTITQNGWLEGDASAVRGLPPQVEGLIWSQNVEGKLYRKLYLGNLFHTYAALLGAEKGYSHMVQCYQDPQIRSEVQRAFFQSERAVLRQWSFDREEHEKWRAMMLAKMDAPSEDTVERVLRDLPRKLRREDRLTGPALLGVRWRCEYDSVLHALVLALKRLAQESPEIRAGLERNSEETAAEVCGLSRRDAAQRELLCRIVQKLEKTIKANEEGYP